MSPTSKLMRKSSGDVDRAFFTAAFAFGFAFAFFAFFFAAISSSFVLSDWVLEEPLDPFARERETLPLEAIHARATLPLVHDESRRLEHLKVSRGGGPGVGEHRGDVAGDHHAALEVQREEN